MPNIQIRITDKIVQPVNVPANALNLSPQTEDM